MSKIKGYQITNQYITVNYDGQTHIISRKESLADKLIAALRDGKSEEIPDIILISKRIEKFSEGNFTVKDGKIYINDQEAPKVLGDKILQFSNDGLPYKPLVKFAKNLQKNPSYRAVNELFGFLEKNNHPITEEGNFIAYKKVRDDFLDVHSGTFDNAPGNVVSMPRNQVNEDPNHTCSYGLHVANYEYASNFYGGGKMIECEVNPADVVAIPVDYNQSKIRVCKYKVLGLVDRKHDEGTSLRITNSSYLSSTLPLDNNDYKQCDNCISDCEESYECCVDYENEDYEYKEQKDENNEDEYPCDYELDEKE